MEIREKLGLGLGLAILPLLQKLPVAMRLQCFPSPIRHQSRNRPNERINHRKENFSSHETKADGQVCFLEPRRLMVCSSMQNAGLMWVSLVHIPAECFFIPWGQTKIQKQPKDDPYVGRPII